jgi:hypothetical protein
MSPVGYEIGRIGNHYVNAQRACHMQRPGWMRYVKETHDRSTFRTGDERAGKAVMK